MMIKPFYLGARKLFLIFLILIFLSTLLLRFIIKFSNEWKAQDQKVSSHSEKMILENILTAKVQPENGKNIFFIDTVRMKKRKKKRPFTSRQACAIESAGESIHIRLKVP